MAGKRDEAKRWLTRATNALNASEALISRKLFDDAISLADAKPREDLSQQLLDAGFTGNLPEFF